MSTLNQILQSVRQSQNQAIIHAINQRYQTQLRKEDAEFELKEDRDFKSLDEFVNEREAKPQYGYALSKAKSHRDGKVREFVFRTNFPFNEDGTFKEGFSGDFLKSIVSNLNQLRYLLPDHRFTITFATINMEGSQGRIEGTHEEFFIRGLTATSDIEHLIDRIINVTAQTGLVHGSDPDIRPHAISQIGYAINAYKPNLEVGAGGILGSFLIEREHKAKGIRYLRNMQCRCRDNTIANKDNDCFLWALKSSLSMNKLNLSKFRKEIGLADGKKLNEMEMQLVLARFAIKAQKHISLTIYSEDMKTTKKMESDDSFTEIVNIELLVIIEDEQDHILLIIEKFNTNEEIEPEEVKWDRENPEAESKYEAIVNYDFETVFGRNGDLFAYACSYMVSQVHNGQVYPGEPKCITILDDPITVSSNGQLINEFFVVEKFIEMLNDDCQNYQKVCLVGFNSSKFDNFILMKYLSNKGIIGNRNLFFSGNSLLRLFWAKGRDGGGSTSYSTWDLRRFVLGSLKYNAEAFKCKFDKKEFDHMETQREYEKGNQGLVTYLKSRIESLVSYNNADVQTCDELFWKVRQAVKDAYNDKRVRVEDHCTLAGMSQTEWRKTTMVETNGVSVEPKKRGKSENKKSSRIVNPETRDEWDFMRKAMIAGRSEAFRAGCFDDSFDMIDVVSLYPYVMTKRSFPIGNSRKTDKYMERKLGVYRVTILRQNPLLDNVVPLRSLDKPLDWKFKGQIECHLYSPDIETFRRYHGIQNIIVHEGYYWNESSGDVFSKYLLPILNGKKQQDKLKAEGSSEYNPALREMCKLIANSLSGKVGQREFDTTKGIITRDAEYKELTMDMENFKSMSVYSIGKVLCYTATYSHDYMVSNYNAKHASPCYLAGFIYAHARSYMYETVISKCRSKIGMDTDSLFITTKDRDNLMRHYPQMFGPEVGQFTTEMAKAYKDEGLLHTTKSRQRFYMNQPKEYCVVDVETNKVVKLRFKGIGPNDRIVNPEAVQTVNKLVKMDAKGKFQHVELKDYFGVIDQLKDLPKALTEDLFKRLQRGEEVCVISSQIQKGAFDAHGVAKLKQNFGAKFLTLDWCLKRTVNEVVGFML